MIRTVTLLALTAGLTLAAQPDARSGSDSAKSESRKEQTSQQTTVDQSRSSYHADVSVESDIQFDPMEHPKLQRQPREAFEAARQAYKANDRQKAEIELRRGADFLREMVQGDRSRPDAQRAHAAADRIEQLATRIYLEDPSFTGDFKPYFGQAYQSLANYQYREANLRWSERGRATQDRGGMEAAAPGPGEIDPENRRVGTYLNSAAENTRNWASETGETLGDMGERALQGAQNAAGMLVKGTGWTAEQVGEGMNGFGNWVQNWGERMKPGEAASTTGSATEQRSDRSQAAPSQSTSRTGDRQSETRSNQSSGSDERLYESKSSQTAGSDERLFESKIAR